MSDETPARDLEKFMLRMPEGMRERIAREAKANGRSMNAELIARIEQSFEDDTVWDQLVGQVDELERDFENRIQELERAMYDVTHHLFPLKYERD